MQLTTCCLTMKQAAYLLLLNFFVLCVAKKRATVKIPYLDVPTERGIYRGLRAIAHDGTRYFKFRGIRYAEPPDKYKRFDESLPYSGAWNGPQSHFHYKADCLAFDHLQFTIDPVSRNRTFSVTGDEDCLYLNVHTRSVSEKVPVIFFIHGGGFGFGGPDQFSSDFIMDRKVVYVNIAYRLGPLGFLSTGDHVVPGNMGLKDQLLALQWVNRYILHFGGDRNRITLTGMSAGGASVHFMYMSPLTDGLFQNALTHSGTALCPWAYFNDIPQKSRQLARFLYCDYTSSERLVGCLRNVRVRLIIEKMADFKVFLFNPFTIFGPVADLYSHTPYLQYAPSQNLFFGKSKNLPFITGVTAEDGLYTASEYILNQELLMRVIKNWEQYLPHILFYDHRCPKENKIAANYFLKWLLQFRNEYSITFASAFLQLISNRLYILPAITSVSLMANTNPEVRLFYFRYRGAASTSDILKNPEDNDLDFVGHADDCAYIYHLHGFELRERVKDRAMSDEMLDLLTSFAENSTLPPSFQMWRSVDDSSTVKVKYLDMLAAKDYTLEDEPTLFNLVGGNVLNCAPDTWKYG